MTHTYYYDGLNLIKEEWGNNTLVFLYDASGSPVGMQYRNSTYASGVWDTYYYEKNLQGDIIAVYNSSGTKLVTYTYDAWGYIISTTYSNGGSSTGAKYNPLKYRGYYYDEDLDLYYLATRYYDPEVCRFVTADDPGYLGANGDIIGYNLYAYCNNNPVMYSDASGHSPVGLIAQFCASALSYVCIAIASIFDERIKNDMDAIGWNIFNTEASVVIEKDSEGNNRKVSFYKGVPVFMFENELLTSFSFLGIFLNSKRIITEKILNHEYGHNAQQMLIGPVKYALGIFAPSALYNLISRESESLDDLYYSMPWERTAEIFGDVISRPLVPYAPYSAEISLMYLALLAFI